jgi:hypothetical protein
VGSFRHPSPEKPIKVKKAFQENSPLNIFAAIYFRFKRVLSLRGMSTAISGESIQISLHAALSRRLESTESASTYLCEYDSARASERAGIELDSWLTGWGFTLSTFKLLLPVEQEKSSLGKCFT